MSSGRWLRVKARCCGWTDAAAAHGWWLALIGWIAAALHLKARDQSIEWSDPQRQARLHLIAQNSRDVIVADRQQLPNLATRALALRLRRLAEDWRHACGHPIVMVESFVDRQLFRATSRASHAPRSKRSCWPGSTPCWVRCLLRTPW